MSPIPFPLPIESSSSLISSAENPINFHGRFLLASPPSKDQSAVGEGIDETAIADSNLESVSYRDDSNNAVAAEGVVHVRPIFNPTRSHQQSNSAETIMGE
jgi:hypothetical protein